MLKKLSIFLIITLLFCIGCEKQVRSASKKKPIKSTDNVKLRSGEKIVDTTPKGYKVTKYNDVFYVDGILIVNKSYALPANYQPSNPYKEITSDYLYGGDYIEKDVMEQFIKMQSDAPDLNFRISSGYRSYKVQEELYNNYVNRDGKEAADTYSARPGYSEHQSGLAFDLNGTNENFINTKEGKWLNDNCYKYGFILRFPKGSEDKTGYMYEGWHFRYVGNSLAEKLYNHGNWISLEEYYGIESKYSN